MLISVFALAAALSAPQAPSAYNALESLPVSAFVIDCQVSGQSLTDCKVVDGDPDTDARAAKALKLAADIQVPETLALANPGRIKIKLNVNP